MSLKFYCSQQKVEDMVLDPKGFEKYKLWMVSIDPRDIESLSVLDTLDNFFKFHYENAKEGEEEEEEEKNGRLFRYDFALKNVILMCKI